MNQVTQRLGDEARAVIAEIGRFLHGAPRCREATNLLVTTLQNDFRLGDSKEFEHSIDTSIVIENALKGLNLDHGSVEIENLYRIACDECANLIAYLEERPSFDGPRAIRFCTALSDAARNFAEAA